MTSNNINPNNFKSGSSNSQTLMMVLPKIISLVSTTAHSTLTYLSSNFNGKIKLHVYTVLCIVQAESNLTTLEKLDCFINNPITQKIFNDFEGTLITVEILDYFEGALIT